MCESMCVRPVCECVFSRAHRRTTTLKLLSVFRRFAADILFKLWLLAQWINVVDKDRDIDACL